MFLLNLATCPRDCAGASGPFWVTSRRVGWSTQCPLFPQKRASAGAMGMSVLGHKRTSGWWLLQRQPIHSALIPAALMIGHHFTISAL
jgi:hypothetical protein